MTVYLNTVRANECNYELLNSTSTFTNWESLLRMLEENGVIKNQARVKALVIEDDGISLVFE